MTRKLSRRDILKLAGGALAAGLAATATGRRQGAASPGRVCAAWAASCDGPGFVSRTVNVPGQRYQAQTPDTLDLHQRANTAINALTCCTNPAQDYGVYFNASLRRNPPVLFNQEQLNGKFMEALALMRIVTGSQMNVQVDRRWRERFLTWLRDSNPVLYGPDGGRQLAWMGINYRIERDACWLEVGEGALARILGKVVDKGDYCYFPDKSGAMPAGWQAAWHSWNLQGTTQFFQATGSFTAREHAGKLARYLAYHGQVFDGDGHFLARQPDTSGPFLHFHHNANALLAIAEYALAAGDAQLAAFARKGYQYGCSVGWPLVGFFPEYIDWQGYRAINCCEGCCVADMILLALTLSLVGQGDYWDDVDRYVRNQFAEMHILDHEWIDRYVATQPPTPVGPGEDGFLVSQRVVGCFGGWATANDLDGGDRHIMNCCTGNGARALYRVWEAMHDFRHGTLTIHLLLNRASPWADVDSSIPYQGRADVRVKQAGNLEVRIPEWVQPGQVTCVVDGAPVALTFRGRYAQVGPVAAGGLVTLTFPITERSVEADIGDMLYMLVLKGNEVVAIDPPGAWCPFYQRADYRQNQVRWVTRERFVAGCLVEWREYLPVVEVGTLHGE